MLFVDDVTSMVTNNMLAVFLKRYKKMILVSILFFYLGCGITLSFIRIECADVITSKKNVVENVMAEFNYAVLILSGPDNEMKRDVIRTTWLNFASNIYVENGEKLFKWNHTWTATKVKQNIIKPFFVIGTRNLNVAKLSKLIIENSRTEDLLLLDNVEDIYQKLSVKMLYALKWLSENMIDLKYLIKCDDDSFVRIDLIIRDLEAFAPQMDAHELSQLVTFKASLPLYKGLYWGYFMGRARVFLKGKWQEKDWFLCNHYLPYAVGGGYVISRHIIDYVAKNIDYLSYYNSEDVSMGVWTAALGGINRVHDIRFDTEWISRGCKDNMLVRHKQTPSEMFEMYRTLVQSGGRKLCKTEMMSRKSYHYNWNVLPTECCK